jgi:hypothetical protein
MTAPTRRTPGCSRRPHGWQLLAVVVSVAAACPALSQVRPPGTGLSAGEGAGILSDVSTNVGAGSRPMSDGSLTIGEASGGPVRSGPVRDPNTRGMLSGPVSSMSQGPVYQPGRSLSSGSMTEASAGTVKQDSDHPLGTRISDPLRELGPLQEQMRARRLLAEQAALSGAMQPAVDDEHALPDEAVHELPADVGAAALPHEASADGDDAAWHGGEELADRDAEPIDDVEESDLPDAIAHPDPAAIEHADSKAVQPDSEAAAEAIE